MKKCSVFDWIVIVLVVIGALNWGLVGFFDYNLVDHIFGGTAGALSVVSRIIYGLVGLAGLYFIYMVCTCGKEGGKK